MNLDLTKLVHPVKRSDGSIVAQCPACAKKGHDQCGKNHLIVFPNGCFGCVLHPKVRGTSDKTRREHLREIGRLLSGGRRVVKKPRRGPIYGRVPPHRIDQTRF